MKTCNASKDMKLREYIFICMQDFLNAAIFCITYD